MRIRSLVTADRHEWAGCEPRVWSAPPGMEEEVAPAESLVDVARVETHVPWQPDEFDLARLAHGGTVWLTVIGGLPPHRLEVRGGIR